MAWPLYALATEWHRNKSLKDSKKVRQPFNVNSLALECASKALKNQSFVQKSIQTNNEGKAFLLNELNAIDCIIPHSEGNFYTLNLKTLMAFNYAKTYWNKASLLDP